MARTDDLGGQKLSEIADYHNDVVDSLRFFWQPSHQQGNLRFFGATHEEFREALRELLLDRIEETEIRSTFAVLAAVEAALRVDYLLRATRKRKDDLSRAFRELYGRRQERARFDEDLLDLWARHHPELKRYIGELRAALKYRHWLAHGRYWQRPTSGRFDFVSIYGLAELLLADFPLYRN